MFNKTISKTVLAAMAGVLALSATLSTASSAAPVRKLQMPKRIPVQAKHATAKFQDDILLVMPNAKSDRDEVADLLREVHGTVVGSMGSGRMLCLIVKSEKGKLAEMEKKLASDKHFAAVQRNYVAEPDFVPNDPGVVNQWHLNAVGAPAAWDISRGDNQRIAILDSGSQGDITELRDKTERGYNATQVASRATTILGPKFGQVLPSPATQPGNRDFQGHGTAVATTAAASFNNSTQGAGIAPNSRVYPINIAYGAPGGGAVTDDIAIMSGILKAMDEGIRIVNISYGAPPPFHFSNAQLHAPLHTYFKEFHYEKGGLIFMSAGNDAMRDDSARLDYLQIVSAVDSNFQLASFSNFGNSVTFAAPGVGIVCSNRNGMLASVNGTSFASPICAGIAALVWSANPGLNNTEVRQIMQQSAMNSAGGGWNQFFGFGMPDAGRAVQLATGQ